MKQYESHDLTLPAWGPYTKQYSGVSHIPKANNGTRFDLSVFPGLFRRRVEPPNVRFEGGWHVWQAAPDLSCYTVRYELEWKDRIYTDVTYLPLGDKACLIRTELHNNTESPQNLVLHYAASAHDPTPSGGGWSIPGADIFLPESATLVMANDYEELHFATPRSSDGLNWDGLRRAEQAVPGFLYGYGIGMGFGTAGGPARFGRILPSGKGDRVSYRFDICRPLESACLLVRYCNDADIEGVYQISTGKRLCFPPSKEPTVAVFELEASVAESLFLELVSEGQGNVKFDCFVLCERSQAEQVSLKQRQPAFIPSIQHTPASSVLSLVYEHLEGAYGIAWDYESFQVRQIENDELDLFLRETAHDHVNDRLLGNRKGHFTDVFMRPIPLQPNQTCVIWGVAVQSETPEQAQQECRSYLADTASLAKKWRCASAMMKLQPYLPAGRPFAFGQQLMQAVLSTNVVYPVYTRRQYIRHNTPGRWWDSLYTWDSGFIGMGLNTLSHQRGLECLLAYLTPPGDDEAAFIHHGTLLPTQFYLFAELIDHPDGRQKMCQLYPKLKSAYEFFVGRTNGSTTADLSSGLLRPWDYFYNSGGWDDYPPQQKVMRNRLQRCCTPVVTTAHAIRFAKIMAYVARVLMLSPDYTRFEEDAAFFTNQLNQLAWDEQAGYYSYLVYDEQGDPTSFLTDEQGNNLNMGLDGASPLFASACPPERARRLWDKLQSSEHLWTEIGISAVDQSAPYYRTDGYWNGSVWMPYQWFFFKAALDAAHLDFAFRIADTALRVWQIECEQTYHCFEHFMVQSGRGAGWHQFGGLSAPVVQWFASYYRPGTITTGFDTFVAEAVWSAQNSAVKARLDCTRAGEVAVLVAMQPGQKNVRSAADISLFRQRHDGLWEIIFHLKKPGCLQFSLE